MPDSEVRRRVLARRLCTGCGMDYNLIQGRPKEEGICDVCGGTLVTREDDTEEALVVRLRDYHEKTDPVLDLFRRKEYVAVIDATPGKAEVQQAIRDRLACRRTSRAASRDSQYCALNSLDTNVPPAFLDPCSGRTPASAGRPAFASSFRPLPCT